MQHTKRRWRIGGVRMTLSRPRTSRITIATMVFLGIRLTSARYLTKERTGAHKAAKRAAAHNAARRAAAHKAAKRAAAHNAARRAAAHKAAKKAAAHKAAKKA